MTKVTIELLDGERVKATRIKHLRTLTDFGGNIDVELYRLADGREIECMSPTNDCRVNPIEVDAVSHYPGHTPGA